MRVSKLMASLLLGPAVFGLVTLPGCGTAPATPAETAELNATSEMRLKTLEDGNPSLKPLVDQSYAYAIVPEVTKGGLGISAGGGKGVVYVEQGKYWGSCQTQFVDLGLTAGAETYTELVLFSDKASFDTFVDSGVKFDSAASATAIQAGVTVKPKYEKGSALLVYNTKGLMFDASVGGQQFTTKPMTVTPGAAPKMQGSPTTVPSAS